MKEANYKTSSNKKQSFNINYKDGRYSIGDNLVDFDYISTSKSAFHLLLNNQSFNAELVNIDYNRKRVELSVNHKHFVIDVEDEFDQLLVKMGIDKGAQQKVDSLRAPMPGLVLSISAKKGNTVSEGDPLLVLEAMKMENVLASPTSGVIKEIRVKSGDKVEKNQTLISFE